MNFYGSSGNTGGGNGPAAPPTTLPGGSIGGGSVPVYNDAPPSNIGKFDLDITNVGGDVESVLQSGAGLIGGVAGGLLGAVGNLGVGGGTIGGAAANAAGAVGQVAGAVGSVPLPFVPVKGITPQGAQGAHVGDIPGEIGNILGLPQQAVQRTVAGERVEAAQQNPQTSDLPADILAKLNSGDYTVAQAADELVKRNAGYTSAPLTNLGLSIVLDPMNFIGGFLGKAATIGKEAGIAVKAADVADEVGAGQRMIGTAYNGLTKNLPGGAHAALDAVLGKTTSGLYHSLGSGTVNGLRDSAAKLAPEYGDAFEDALGVANQNITQAAVADLYRQEITNATGKMAEATRNELNDHALAFQDKVAQRTHELAALDPNRLGRTVENFLDRVKGDFAGVSQDTLRAETAQKLALTTGMSVEDAASILPKVIDRDTAATVHLVAYGKLVDELEGAKSASLGSKVNFGEGFGVGNLTAIAPDTLTQERARDLLTAISKRAPENVAPGLSRAGRQARNLQRPASAERAVEDAVNRYDVLSRRFLNKPHSVEDVEAFVRQIADRMPNALLAPKTGENPLPEALSAWRDRWNPLGYDAGFAPKDGLKTITTAEGDTFPLMPFLPASSEKLAPTLKNPLGRFFDGMMRGVSQTKIINTARYRMVRSAVDANLLTPIEARTVFKRVLDAAVDRAASPRGLGGPEAYNSIFRDALGPSRYQQFLEAGGNPTWLTNFAFQNEAKNVGLTQAATGLLKTQTTAGGNFVSRVSEQLYPAVRFTLSPLFWAQNLIESPIMAALRGIGPRIDPEVHALYGDLITSNDDVRHMYEAGVTLQFAGNKAASRLVDHQTLLGRAVARFPDVHAIHQHFALAQVLGEHGEQFKEAMTSINPRLWRSMEDAYGTKDATKIARSWAKERLQLAGDPESAVNVMRSALPKATSADEQTIYNAFQYSLGESMRAAIRTQYFNPERGFLERTINHPFLGLYPASYMWGHILPEFARFLILRPFGRNVPLAGYAAAVNVQKEIQAQVAANPDFAQWVKDHAETIYLADMMLPGDPTDLPANAPAWLRHAAQGKLDVGQLPADTFKNLGIGRDIGLAGSILGENNPVQGGDLFGLLDKSAKEYDTTVLPNIQASLSEAQRRLIAP